MTIEDAESLRKIAAELRRWAEAGTPSWQRAVEESKEQVAMYVPYVGSGLDLARNAADLLEIVANREEVRGE